MSNLENSIQIDFPISDWVWLCEFLSTLLHELEGDELEDTERILNLLQSAESGEVKL